MEADFFFRFAPFENFMMKLLYEYVDEYKAKGFNVLKFEATYLYHVWNSRSWPLAVNTLLLQHNSICRMERTVGPNSKNPPKNKIREIN